MRAELYVLSGRDAGRGLTASVGPPLFVGRAATNHLRLRDAQASRVHIRLDVTSEGLILSDNNSGNGTFVNGERVTRSRRLEDNDEIRLGETRIRVLIETPADLTRWGPATLTPETGPIRQAPRDTRRGSPGALRESTASAPEAGSSAGAAFESGDGSSSSGSGSEGGRRRSPLRELLPGYELEARLGGHGRDGVAVYRAQQRSVGRLVALKVLLAKGPTRRSDVAGYLEATRAAARLTHPHLVTTHDIVQRGSLNAVVMEYLAGGSLADRLDDGPLSPLQTLDLGEAVAAALAYAHEHGVAHLAIRPSNVLYAPQVDAWKLADFGASIPPAALEESAPPPALVAGLPFLAPELLDGPGDPRSDVWGLGALLFACMTGRAPIEGASPAQLLEALRRQPIPVPARAPASLSHILQRCLDRDPGARYPDARTLLHELGACRAALSSLEDVPA